MRRTAYIALDPSLHARDGGVTAEPAGEPTAWGARLLQALAHPIRLGILRSLLRGTSCVTDFVTELDCEQPKVSQHLKVLRDSGLIACRTEGRKRCYSLRSSEQTREVLRALERLRDATATDGSSEVSCMED